MIESIIEICFKREFQLVFVADLVLLKIFTAFYDNFKTLNLVLAACLIALLIYLALSYVVDLANYMSEINAVGLDGNYDASKLEMGDFLFRNESFYKFVKSVILKLFYDHKVRKLDRLEMAAELKLVKDKELLEQAINSGNEEFIKRANLQLSRRQTYIMRSQKKKLEIEAKTKRPAKKASDAAQNAYNQKLLKKLNSSHHMHLFAKKFSAFFIEPWYLSFIGNDQEFLMETQMQAESFFLDIYQRVVKIDKLKFAAQLAFMFKNNYLNIAIAHNYHNTPLPLENLHPALHNSPDSEIYYLKRFVQIALNKSASELNINQVISEEFFMQIVGKNCLEKLINLITRPSFVYYVIAFLCEDEDTVERFSSSNPNEFVAKDAAPQTQPADAKEDDEPPVKLETTPKKEVDSTPRRFSTTPTGDHISFTLSEGSSSGADSRSNSINSSTNERTITNFEELIEITKKRRANQVKRTRSDISDTISASDHHHHQVNVEEYDLSPYLDWDAISSRYEIEIFNLKIGSTETGYESKTGNSFTLYHINYKYRFNDLTKLDAPASGSPGENFKAKLVKRRHREFVLLHKKLEENPALKQYVRGIRGPSKFLTLPFGNMDEYYVERRRYKLSEYLNQLIKTPAICQSKELCAFLSYEFRTNNNANADETYSEFQRGSSDNGIIKAFSGVFDKITSTTASLNPLSTFNKRVDDIVIDSTIEFGKLQINNYQYTDYSSHDVVYAKFNKIKLDMDTRCVNTKESHKRKRSDETSVHLSKTLFEICNQFLTGSTALTNLANECWVNNSKIYRLIEMCLCDYYFEKFFEEFFEFLFNEASLIDYLHDLEDILFVDEDNQSKFIDDYTEFYDFARKQLLDLFPKVFMKTVGTERFNAALKVFLDALKIPLLNKHFAYCALDLLLFTLYTDEFNDIDISENGAGRRENRQSESSSNRRSSMFP